MFFLVFLVFHSQSSSFPAGGTKITLLGPRTRIVLAGHDLKLNFNITLPPNTTMDNLRCYNSDGHVYSYESKEEEQEVLLRFTDSRQSGVYHCKCKHAIVYLAVLVRGEYALQKIEF